MCLSLSSETKPRLYSSMALKLVLFMTACFRWWLLSRRAITEMLLAHITEWVQAHLYMLTTHLRVTLNYFCFLVCEVFQSAQTIQLASCVGIKVNSLIHPVGQKTHQSLLLFWGEAPVPQQALMKLAATAFHSEWPSPDPHFLNLSKSQDKNRSAKPPFG